jgi:hypothetical protein
LPFIFNFALEYAIGRAKVNDDSLKLNGKYKLLVLADNINTLGGSVYIIKKNRRVLVTVGKEIGREVNSD